MRHSGKAADLLDNQIVQDAYLGGQGGSSRAIEERIRAKRREILASSGFRELGGAWTSLAHPIPR